MDLDPRISTPRQEPARESGRSFREKWPSTYDDYMQSATWRDTRNAALRRAKWTCAKCPANRTLQVHHITYERLGCELDSDLEVLCIRCHEGVHIDESAKVRGIYLVLVTEVLRRETLESMADLLDAVKTLCAQRKIRYDSHRIWKAVGILDATRLGIGDAPRPRVKPPTLEDTGRPVTKDEARECLRMLGISVADRHHMPQFETDDYARDVEKANLIRRQAAAMVAGGE